MKNRYGLHRIMVLALGVSVTSWTTSASALTINFANGVESIAETPWITCQRDNDGDKCRTTAFCSSTAQNKSSLLYSSAWEDFKSTHAGWTNVDGGALEGTITIDKFTPYSSCPDNQGVEISASFRPMGHDPVDWRWSQGLFATPTNVAHGGPVPDRKSYMDCNIPGNNEPPLYPFSYPDGHFYDKPGRQCVDSSTVSWVAVALISSANFNTKTLTTYEGFAWGFDVECRPVPEPMSLFVTSLAIGAVMTRRRKQE